jgi:cytochrome c551/c552
VIDAIRFALAVSMTLLLAGAARAGGDAVRGEVKFQDCAACHKLEAGANNVGPSLHGIFTRKAGELADFRYSPAIKRSGITWTPDARPIHHRPASPGTGQPHALCRHGQCRGPRRPHRLFIEGGAVILSARDSPPAGAFLHLRGLAFTNTVR